MVVPVGAQGIARAWSHNAIDWSPVITGASESLLQTDYA